MTDLRGARSTGLGVVLLLLGLLAGTLNHEVLDGPRFAQHVDDVRRDPAVAARLSTEITSQLLVAEPDLVAARPLLQAAVEALVASDAFSPVVRAAARDAHRTLTGDTSGQVTFRLTDVGALLAEVLPAVAPDAAAQLPPDLAVTLASVDESAPVARAVRLAHLLGVLAWLLPLLAIGCLAAGWWWARDRLAAAARAARGVACAGVGVASVAVLGSLAAARAPADSLPAVLLAAAWRELAGALWLVAVVTVVAGGVLALVFSGRRLTVGAALRWIWVEVGERPAGTRAQAVRAGALAVTGGLVLLDPVLSLRLLAVAAGTALLLLGIEEAAGAARRTAAQRRPEVVSRRAHHGGSRTRAGAGLAALALLLGLVGLGAAPTRDTDQIVDATAQTAGRACNGHVELCVRRYSDVAFPAAHNAMSAADEPGWFLAEQPTGLVGQLDAGVRVLLIDSYYGRPTSRPGFTVTSTESFDGALAASRQDFDPALVQSALRLRAALTPSVTGPVQPYLCHGLCETGSTPMVEALTDVRRWMQSHPREVVTLFVEDAVSPADTASVVEQTGLLPAVHTQAADQAWPTLEQMIDSGRRLVVLAERRGGGSEHPWLLQGFDRVQDTPFTNPTAADLSCTPNRGPADAPLLLVNHWLSGFDALVSNAREVNAAGVLGAHVERCRRERGQIPNFVAVNYVDQGDLYAVVDRLNGVG